MDNENQININLGFAFEGNISEKILARLNCVDEKLALSDALSIKNLLEMIVVENPLFVLGLGVYTGRDQDKIRIEQVCTNKFRNRLVSVNSLEKLEINSFLTPSKNAKFTYKMGNSWCNLVSWEIMSVINKHNLKTQYTFLHIPKKMDLNNALIEINNMLRLFKDK